MPLFDLYPDLLEQEPKLPYYAKVHGQQRSPNQTQYFQGAYNDIYNEYLGRLGQQMQGGQDPTLRWTDFLAEMPFIERFARLTPQERGENPSVFNPRTLFRY